MTRAINSLGKDTLMFPRDMGKPFSPESIKFTIYTRDGASYKNVRKDIQDSAGAVGELGGIVKGSAKLLHDVSKARDGETAALRKKRVDSVTSTLKAAGSRALDEVTESFFKAGSTIKEELKKGVKPKKEYTTESHVQSIYLNMPNSVVFNESVEWQGQDLGAIGAMKSGLSAGEAAEVALLGNAGAVLGGAAGAITSALPGISGIAGTVVGAVAGAGGLQGALESTFNIKANPYKEQTFQGIPFRSFDFTFALRARSSDDVDEIQNIIRSFRSHSKPTFETAKGGVFAYPKEFRIEYLTLDDSNSYVTNKYLPEIKYCVCTAVNTNFTQQGWRSFEGGAPVDISLQLTFQETEIITSEDVEGNTSVGRFTSSGEPGEGRRF